MNTGIQRSGATPFGASTTTSPAGVGELRQAAAAQGHDRDRGRAQRPLRRPGRGLALARPLTKVEHAVAAEGPAFLNVLSDCPVGWGHEPRLFKTVLDLAVETRLWPLYEVVDGDYRVTYVPKERVPVSEWFALQTRFAHLAKPEAPRLRRADPGSRRSRLGAAPAPRPRRRRGRLAGRRRDRDLGRGRAVAYARLRHVGRRGAVAAALRALGRALLRGLSLLPSSSSPGSSGSSARRRASARASSSARRPRASTASRPCAAASSGRRRRRPSRTPAARPRVLHYGSFSSRRSALAASRFVSAASCPDFAAPCPDAPLRPSDAARPPVPCDFSSRALRVATGSGVIAGSTAFASSPPASLQPRPGGRGTILDDRGHVLGALVGAASDRRADRDDRRDLGRERDAAADRAGRRRRRPRPPPRAGGATRTTRATKAAAPRTASAAPAAGRAGSARGSSTRGRRAGARAARASRPWAGGRRAASRSRARPRCR